MIFRMARPLPTLLGEDGAQTSLVEFVQCRITTGRLVCIMNEEVIAAFLPYLG